MNNEIKICSIASGSNGNAYYIESNGEALLVDAGIGVRAFLQRAKERGIDYKKIKYIFVTHEHSDHVRGLHAICRATNARAFMTRGTAKKTKPYYMPKEEVTLIERDSVTEVGPFSVVSFAKPHDVEEPCSFRVVVGNVSIGVFTDIGTACDGLIENLGKCHVAFLESNYDEAMLRDGKYPAFLKERVASEVGHLSNVQAADLVRMVNPPYLHTLFLSHISADNNRPQIALKAFEEFKDRYQILTASRYEAGELITVGDNACIFPQQKIVFPDRLDRNPISVAEALSEQD